MPMISEESDAKSPYSASQASLNYDNFDELSDTSTLVGEDLAENISETGNLR